MNAVLSKINVLHGPKNFSNEPKRIDLFNCNSSVYRFYNSIEGVSTYSISRSTPRKIFELPFFFQSGGLRYVCSRREILCNVLCII